MAHGCTYCTDDFHCEKFTDEKFTSWCYGKDYPCKDRRTSNADRIRSMTDEELAKFMNNVQATAYNSGLLEMKIQGFPAKNDAWLDWLKEEVTANDS